jgi:hypothetical protein
MSVQEALLGDWGVILQLERAKLLIDDLPDNPVRSHCVCTLEKSLGDSVAEFIRRWKSENAKFKKFYESLGVPTSAALHRSTPSSF